MLRGAPILSFPEGSDPHRLLTDRSWSVAGSQAIRSAPVKWDTRKTNPPTSISNCSAAMNGIIVLERLRQLQSRDQSHSRLLLLQSLRRAWRRRTLAGMGWRHHAAALPGAGCQA